MADQHPDKPSNSKSDQDWNEVSAQEVEQKLSNASELAYELAGDIGGPSTEPPGRSDSAKLRESIENTLDVELKQLEHLVEKTKEQIDDAPASPPVPSKAAPAVPDFMAEFLSDEPVKVIPDPAPHGESAMTAATDGSAEAQKQAERGPAPGGNTISSTPVASPSAKAGVVGVGTLGRSSPKKPPKPAKPKVEALPKPAKVSRLAPFLEKHAFGICGRVVSLLERLDRPFGKLGPRARRALGATAIAMFCVCLAMYVLSLLMF